MLALQIQKGQVGNWWSDPLPRDFSCSTTAIYKSSKRIPSNQYLTSFSLQAGHGATNTDTDCSICLGNVRDPVVTECQHVYCFECIYLWFGTSTLCPVCRKDLHGASFNLKSPAVRVSTSPSRFSSSQWLRTSGGSVRSTLDQQSITSRQSTAVSPSSYQTPSRNSISFTERGSPPPTATTRHQIPTASYQYRTAPLATKGQTSRHRRTPSYGSTAYIDLDYAPPLPSAVAYPSSNHSRSASYRDFMTAEARACAEIIRHNGGQPPQSRREFDSAASRAGVIFCDSEYMLGHMWHVSNSIAEEVHVPLRCRAIAKCCWREWRNFLRAQDGRWLLAQDVVRGLSRTMESAVVEYGWAQSWRDLPVDFVDILRQTAEAGAVS